MGVIIDTMRKALTRSSNLPLPVSGNHLWQHRGLPYERDYVRDVGDGSQSNLVEPGIEFITNGFLEAPVRVQQRTGDELVPLPDHPMLELLEQPNPFYSGPLLWMPTLANWILDGNAYWIIKEFSGAGRPITLYWIPSWLIEPKGPPDGSEFLTTYEYRPNGQQIQLDPMQVVHFRYGLDPQNPRKGYSRLKKVLREIYSDEEAARFTAALLHNVGAHGIVLSPEGEVQLTPQEAKDMGDQIDQKTTGDKRGSSLVFFSPTKLQEFGFSPQEMDLANLRAIPESRVAAALGIPAAVLGFLAGMEQTKVGATMSELREQGYETGIIPKMRLMAKELQTQLLRHYTDNVRGYAVDFDTSGVRVLQDDENKLVTRIDTRVRGGWMTIAAGKRALGEEPLPTDDVYLRSIAQIEVTPGEEQLPRNITPITGPRAASRMKKATPQQLAYVKRTTKEGQRLGAVFAGELQRAFEDLGKRASAAWEARRKSFVADPQDEALVLAIVELMDLPEWRARTLDPLWSRHYQRAFELTFGALRENLAIEVGTDMPDVIAREVIASGGRNLGLIDLEQQTKDALFEALSAAREEGLGPVQAARRISQYVGAGRYTGMEAERPGSGVRYRAELIARTETLNAQRVSVAETGKAAGFSKYLAFDNRTGFGDEECVARDGKEFTYDEMLAETAAEHPNGTLSWSPVPGSQSA